MAIESGQADRREEAAFHMLECLVIILITLIDMMTEKLAQVLATTLGAAADRSMPASRT